MNKPFGLLLALAALYFTGCDGSRSEQAKAPQQTSTTSTDGNVGTRQSFGDFEIAIPPGWSVVTPDRGKTKVQMLLGGTTWQNAKGMIKVDVGTPVAPTSSDLADSFAQGSNGTVSPEPILLDGVSGHKVSTPSKSLETPREVIIVYRDGKVYLLMAAGVEGSDVSAAIAEVAKSWKWTSQPNR